MIDPTTHTTLAGQAVVDTINEARRASLDFGADLEVIKRTEWHQTFEGLEVRALPDGGWAAFEAYHPNNPPRLTWDTDVEGMPGWLDMVVWVRAWAARDEERRYALCAVDIVPEGWDATIPKPPHDPIADFVTEEAPEDEDDAPTWDETVQEEADRLTDCTP